MDFQLNNLLIGKKFADYTFTNPLELRYNENGEVIGSAVLTKTKNELCADLTINKHVDYIHCYPRIAVDIHQKSIGYIYLSEGKSIDPEVKTIKEQMTASK